MDGLQEATAEPTDKLAAIDEAITKASEAMLLNPLKPKQLEAIRTFMSGRDTFVSLPTGYGKSVIYAILPLAFDLFLGMYDTIWCYNNSITYYVLQEDLAAGLWLLAP